MTKGIVQKVFDRKTKHMPDWIAAFMIEELKHELVLEIGKQLDSYHLKTSYERTMFRRWLIGDN